MILNKVTLNTEVRLDFYIAYFAFQFLFNHNAPLLMLGLRPFGVSLLYMGWDRHHGFQLYQSDPSGNYGGWMATCIGANSAVCCAYFISGGLYISFLFMLWKKMIMSLEYQHNIYKRYRRVTLTTLSHHEMARLPNRS